MFKIKKDKLKIETCPPYKGVTLTIIMKLKMN